MPRRTKPQSSADAPLNLPEPRATPAATLRYCEEFQRSFAADYFRKTDRGLVVSSIGIGTYLGDSTDDVDAAYERAIQQALRGGINVVDTAINYRAQRSERAIGLALRSLIASGDLTRDQIVVCTKGGYIPFDGEPPGSREAYREYVRREYVETEIVRPKELVGGGHSLAPRFLKYCLAKSRQNLGLRTIDTYYVHNPGQQLGAAARDEVMARLREAFTALEEAAERDEIGTYGVATWESLRVPPDSPQYLSLAEMVDVARDVAGDAHHFSAVQLPISLAMPEAAAVPTQLVDGSLLTAIQAAEHFGLTVVASATLMQSKLASGLPDQARAALPGQSDAQRAISFTRTLPGVDVALVGMKQSEHVDDTLQAGRL